MNDDEVMFLQSDLYYPLFLMPKFSTPNFFEEQSNLYYPGLYYPQFLGLKSTPKYCG